MNTVYTMGLLLADQAVVADIEGLPVLLLDGDDELYAWRDTRPCLDEREHSPPVLDMWNLLLRYADERQLIVRHGQQTHLVRINRALSAGLRA